MTNDEMLRTAKRAVVKYFNSLNYNDGEYTVYIGEDNVFIVWFCKTLQNWKAMASTTIHDGRYYELTYNGDKNELYLDSYVKEKNVCHSI